MKDSLLAQLVKNLPTMQETPVPFLGQQKGRKAQMQTKVMIRIKLRVSLDL